ncbi:MAG: peptidylprolyl isomerase [Planctomycetota bacterium]|nr:peptidylprolyl isomerase [Planctomycetota bacterium]
MGPRQYRRADASGADRQGRPAPHHARGSRCRHPRHGARARCDRPRRRAGQRRTEPAGPAPPGRAGQGPPPPADEAVRKFYQENLKEFTLPERIHAAHIVKHVTPCKPPEVCEEALRKAKEELAAGAEFAVLAVKYSDCPENGGDLGWFARGRMVEEFENTVFKMKPGEVSDIFASRYGFHIVKVFDRKPAGPASIEEVDGYIRSRLAADAHNVAIEKFLDGLRTAAKVEDVA